MLLDLELEKDKLLLGWEVFLVRDLNLEWDLRKEQKRSTESFDYGSN
jgi:hypothetical protein